MNLAPYTPATFSPRSPAWARVMLVEADRRLDARVVAPGALALLSYVQGEGPYAADLTLEVEGSIVTVALNQRMLRGDIVSAINNALPRGYELVTAEASTSGVLIVGILRLAAG